MEEIKNIEIEKTIIGILLTYPEAIKEINTIPEEFTSARLRLIYQTIQTLNNNNVKPDIITVSHHIEKKGKNILQRIGGKTFIAELTETILSAENIKYYEKELKQNFLKRNIRDGIQIITNKININKDIEEIIKELNTLIDHNIYNQTKPEKLNKITLKTFEAIENRKNQEKEYIPTGFRGIDDIISGFPKAELTIIGARPSVGKTALATSIITKITLERKTPSILFSLEMTKRKMVERIIASMTGINTQRIQQQILSTEDLRKIRDILNVIQDAPLYIHEQSDITTQQIKTITQTMKITENIKMIIIDYITLITPEKEIRNTQSHEQITKISKDLKKLAAETKIPIIALSQLTRDTEGISPKLSSIRGSGSIEQDADIVMFIHRKENEESGNEIPTKIIIAKNRNGPTGATDLTFIKNTATFTENIQNEYPI